MNIIIIKNIYIYFLLSFITGCGLFTADLNAQALNTISNDGTTANNWYAGIDTAARLGIGIPHKQPLSNVLTIRDYGNAGSQTFIPGWMAGSGWKIEPDTAGKYMLTIDDLTLRGTLSVYELLLNQVRATNGNLLVTSSAVADSVAADKLSFWVKNVTGLNAAPFAAGDIIICQGADMSGAGFDERGNIINNNYLIKRIIYRVVSTSGTRVYIGFLTGAPALKNEIKKGDVFCRIGNTTNASRMGVIGLFSDEAHSPYLRVTDSVKSWSDWQNPASVKVQLGKLTGITDPDFGGQLEGYGLYASNAYIKGKIVVTNPSDFTIEMLWDSINNKPAYFNAPGGSGLFITANNMGYYNSSTYPSDPWRTYMDNQGRFYLKGNGNDYLSWNGSTLVIKGNGNALDISSNNSINDINNTLYNFGTDIYQNSVAIGLRAYKTTTDSLGNVLSQVGTGLTATQNSLNLYAKKDSVKSYIDITPDMITINGTTTFESGYNPADKITKGDAASDINDNITTIDGGKITTGTISADKMDVGSLSAISANLGTITAGTINAATVNVNNINADNIKYGTLNADRIGSESITSDKIASGTITASDIASSSITADKLNVTNLSAITANLGNVTAGNLSGISITGSKFQTSDSGQRIEISSSTNAIRLFNIFDDCIQFYCTGPSGNPILNITGTSAISVSGQQVAFGGHAHSTTDITSGLFSPSRLGTGTVGSSTFLRGDGTWANISVSGSTSTTLYVASASGGAATTQLHVRTLNISGTNYIILVP